MKNKTTFDDQRRKFMILACQLMELRQIGIVSLSALGNGLSISEYHDGNAWSILNCGANNGVQRDDNWDAIRNLKEYLIEAKNDTNKS